MIGSTQSRDSNPTRTLDPIVVITINALEQAGHHLDSETQHNVFGGIPTPSRGRGVSSNGFGPKPANRVALMEHTGPSSHPAAEGTAATDALGRSHLGKLPRQTLERILEAATHVTVPAGSLLHREGDTAAHLQVVVDGLLRVFVTALDGRTLTVRYCRAGSILGAVSLFASPFSMPASVQAVTDAHIVSMPAQSVRDSADRDVVVARAIIDELSERVMSFISEIPGSAFATVKQRIARHLLDLATSNQTGPELTARISQQELAEAVGTVREVVVRSLRDLREDGSVDTGRDGIVILDAQGLSEAAYRGHGTHVPWP